MNLTIVKQSFGLLGWIIVCFVASAIGALGSMNAPSFYAELTQPSWAPEPWLFGPVWTALYTMMAVSAWLIWRKGGFKQHTLLLSVFLGQLILNALWSWIFFAWLQGGWAFFEILLLAISILVTIVLFARANKVAAALLIPYFGWVCFASALNFSLWQMNPTIL